MKHDDHDDGQSGRRRLAADAAERAAARRMGGRGGRLSRRRRWSGVAAARRGDATAASRAGPTDWRRDGAAQHLYESGTRPRAAGPGGRTGDMAHPRHHRGDGVGIRASRRPGRDHIRAGVWRRESGDGRGRHHRLRSVRGGAGQRRAGACGRDRRLVARRMASRRGRCAGRAGGR